MIFINKEDYDMSTQVNNINVQLGNKIKTLRNEREMSQKALSKELGVSGPYIAQIELGQKGGSYEFIMKVEKFFQLQTNTLLNLRANKSVDPIEEPEVKAAPVDLPVSLPNPIQHFVNTLLSYEEEYVLKKIPNWLKELEEGLFNQLKAYELAEIKDQVMGITRTWIEESKNTGAFEEDSPTIQGYIDEDAHKHFFSLQLNHHVLTLNCVNEDKQIVQHFEKWLGTCSISYSLSQQLPYFGEEKEVSYFLWFNPLVSITEMYSYLKKLPNNMNNMEMNEPRLNWYINELNG